MEISQLKYFLDVAETQHITESARRLHIAQPALSRTIHKLENTLGVKLIEAKGRNIVLTDCGKFLRDRLKPMMEELDALPDMLRALAKLNGETIHLNVLAASYLITHAIIDYKAKHRELNFQLLQNHESDLFDIEITTEMPKARVNIEDNTFYCHEKIFLAVPNSERFAERDSITLREVAGEGFISLIGSRQFRAVCDRYCHSAEISPRIIFESDNISAIKNMIAANIGVGFWPEFTWGRPDSDKVKLLEITDPNCGRDIKITYRKNDTNDSSKHEFFRFLTDFITSLKKVSENGRKLSEI